MTEDEIKELDEQIAEAGGAKYANSFTVIGDPHDMSILFMTHEVPTACVTISYKACRRLIELLQESLDSAKAKEEVSAENVPQVNPNMGTVFQNLTPDEQDEFLNKTDDVSPLPDLETLLLENLLEKAVHGKGRLAESCRQSAIDTLHALGYTYRGGVRWAPPLGKPPAWVEKDQTT